MRVVFIDIEANPETKEVYDFAAIDQYGNRIHTKNVLEFIQFLKQGQYECLCGHNIIDSDLLYLQSVLESIGEILLIDTLYLSPLVFPVWPYHHLLKDEKLWTEEKNNPLNDAVKTRDLFFEELETWLKLDQELWNIYTELLQDQKYFSGFFKYLEQENLILQKASSRISLRSFMPTRWRGGSLSRKIINRFRKKICSFAELNQMLSESAIALAYCLAVINSGNKNLNMPVWVHRHFPVVESIMFQLRGTPCNNGCSYCRNNLSARSQLKKIFGYDNFRVFEGKSLQEDAVNAALRQKSLLAVFPTGGGKSLTFQLPAIIQGNAVNGLTVIISPLQALMKDQVDNIEHLGLIDAVTINGMQNPLERQDAIQRVMNGTATMLYLSPESLRSRSITNLLLSRHVVRFVVDEAHCLSTWGQDFRVDYQFIGQFAKYLQKEKGLDRPIPVSCFTATAKQKVVSDIRDYFRQTMLLHLLLFTTDSSRENLRYEVVYVKTDYEKYQMLRELILDRDCPTIVYTSRTRKTEEVADQLIKDGISAVAFHGQMDSNEKRSNQEHFLKNDVRVIVATSAFGMGVDKPDVQLVIHYNIPDSLENYTQEAGRAGRDPALHAECYILFRPEDMDDHFQLLNQTRLTIHDIQKVWRAIRDLSRKREKFSASALEIAEAAGWNVNLRDLETKVRSALNALEIAGYIRRHQNMSFIYASSIEVDSQMAAIEKIDASGIFTEKERENAKRITSSLFTSRTTYRSRGAEAESRTDHLADLLGMTRFEVTRLVNKLRQAGILRDDKDMTALFPARRTEKYAKNRLNDFSKLENYIFDCLESNGYTVNLKKINENAEKEGINSTVKMIKTIISFWSVQKYINKVYWGSNNEHTLELNIPLKEMIEKRQVNYTIGEFVITYLYSLHSELDNNNTSDDSDKVVFSAKGIMDSFNVESLFEATIDDVEEALMYLLKIDAILIDGGFLVLYSPLTIERRETNNRINYKKTDYSQLDEYYKMKIQQIHIIGEFANIMTHDYSQGLLYVKDYFQLEYEVFIRKYFDRNRQKEIKRNITPEKYNKISEALSDSQKMILEDDESKYIVVLAGPGSGKTRILVHKLASLLTMENIKSDELLMLTFSRAATMEFKKKLIELIGIAAFFVEIRTFHSYCFDLIGKIGSLEGSKNVIEEAVRRIQNNEVEKERISKAVIVLDEAQDMDEQSFSLLQEMMKQYPSMRIIAVGDDDQNIYAFRGSSSVYFNRLITQYQATTYEMSENYRSRSLIVHYSNEFALTISDRMKTLPCIPIKTDEGSVRIVKHVISHFEIAIIQEILKEKKNGSVCVLTNTNFKAAQMVSLLHHNNVDAKLIESNDGFDTFDLAEIRFFFQQLKMNKVMVSQNNWTEAVDRLSDRYRNSMVLPICLRILESYERLHQKYYLTDLEIFLHETHLEDYISEEMETVTVSTIHKVKGKEFDHVYIMLTQEKIWDDEARRVLYVGMTRAKESLSIHYWDSILDDINVEGIERTFDPALYQEPDEIILQLGFRDVYLDFFKDANRKKFILKYLFSGAELEINGNRMYSSKMNRPYPVVQLSKKGLSQVQNYREKGFLPVSVSVRYIVAWRPKNVEEKYEYAVLLPTIIMQKAKDKPIPG